MKKRWLLGCSLLLLGSFLWAKTGDTMYVSAKEVELKSGTGFFASKTGLLSYGTKVTVLAEEGKWIQVASADNGKTVGWLPASSLTRKKILADSGLSTVSASADELALAGKGFSAEVEARYTTESTAAIYKLIDEMEATPMDRDELWGFIRKGGLSDGSGGGE